MKIKTKKAVKDFIVSTGNCVTTSEGKKYYYLPYYYEDCGNGVFDEIQYTALPTDVIKAIEDKREFRTQLPKHTDAPFIRTGLMGMGAVQKLGIIDQAKQYVNVHNVSLAKINDAINKSKTNPQT